MRRAALICLLSAAAAAAEGEPFRTTFRSHDVEFEYSWPSEASAIPALVHRLTSEMRKQKGNVIRGARDERRNYEPGAVLPYRFSATVTKRGETRRLLSLETETQYLSGGAHRNFDYESLLWDRQLNQSVKPPSLFDDPGALTKQRRTICRAIDDVRFRRTGVRNGSECPKFDELAVVPTDTNKAGHFDAIDFLAAPYVAGSFAEGTYEVLLPVTPKLIAALKPEYRSSFKAQRGASLRAKSFDPYSEHSGMLAQRQ